jgi:DNA-binding beta-propeller fold protein YncE
MNPTHCRLPLRNSLLLAVGLLLAWPASVWPQSITATIPLSGNAFAIAVNRVTNKIYVTTGATTSAVTVIDGTTHATATVQTGSQVGKDIAVNEATNKIYIATGTGVIVLDGVTNATTTLVDPNAYKPYSLAVNPSTNKIYVANYGVDAKQVLHGGNVTVIDGVTNATTTITDPNARGLVCVAVAVNPVTNKIYVANNSLGFSAPGNVTVIDGTTNTTTTVAVSDPGALAGVPPSSAIAVNQTTNKIYVTSANGVTVIDGGTNATTPVSGPSFLQGQPTVVAVNSVTDKIYAAYGGSGGLYVVVIDGATNSTTWFSFANAGAALMAAVNESTDMVYFANYGLGYYPCGCNGWTASISVLDPSTNSQGTIIDPHAYADQEVVVNPNTNQVYLLGIGSVTIIDGGSTATTHALGLVMTGSLNASGTVTSDPSGIYCSLVTDSSITSADCTPSAASFAIGAVVHMAAAPGANVAVSWGGACSGSGSCDVTMNSDQFVTANFNLLSTGSAGGGVGGGSGGGGGGGMDGLTLGALLAFLGTVARRARPRVYPIR